MTDQPKQDAIVSQRDREIAADYWCSSDHSGKRRMLDGSADNSDLLKMLATYRAEIEAATIERITQLEEEIRVMKIERDGPPFDLNAKAVSIFDLPHTAT